MSRVQSIKKKLTLSYIIYIILFVLFVGMLSNVLIQRQFIEYATNKQENELTQIVKEITNQYDEGWDVNSIELISSYVLDKGFIITVTDLNNNTIWDANIHNGHKCQMVIDNIVTRMRKSYPNWNGKYIIRNYMITNSSNQLVGNIKIGYLSPYFYTEEDLIFLTSLNKLYLIASIIFIVIALLLGTYMAKRLSKPLYKVVQATANISKGIYEKIPSNNSNIKEIKQLTHSINELITTLKNQELLRKQLTADVTHELRTPLTTLQTHIEAMIDGVLEVDKNELDSIYEEIIRINKIVTDLDKLSRYDKETYDLNKENVNISHIIENVLNIFKVEYMSKNILFHFDKKDIYVNIDKDKINQVFINLISNAIKYTPSFKEIFIKIDEDINYVKIIIKDTGIGISEEDLPHIFERFYRADKSRNRDTGGSGIGLTIVKSIITAHKGKISVQSKINEGTEFIIMLPKKGG